MAVKIPDALTDDQKAQLVVDTLVQLQVDETNLNLARVRAGGKGDGPSGVFNADGTAVSIDAQAEVVQRTQQALVEQYSDLMPRVQEIIDTRNAAIEAQTS